MRPGGDPRGIGGPGGPIGGPVILALILLAIIAWAASRHNRGPHRPGEPDTTSTGRPLGERRLTIEFLDVGQGDSALIRSPEGKLALVDAGPSAGQVAALLRERGVERLDLAVVSHHHADHYGGMLEVVQEFHPRVFLDAASPQTSKHYEALLRTVRDEEITAIQPEASPRRVTLGSVDLTILPRAPVDPHNENNNSVGLRVDFGDFSALLTGDSEVRERAWWSEHCPDLGGHVSVLKLAHHGSRNGTSDAWLALTRPELTVASMGLGNEFGHPHPETLRRLRHDNIPLRRTDEDGTVTVSTDGASWAVRSGRRGAVATHSGPTPAAKLAAGAVVPGPPRSEAGSRAISGRPWADRSGRGRRATQRR